jgi:cytochrome d ubiquinol oxidase subunit I
MELDAVLLSRIQFAFTAGFHFLFPPLTIGLAAIMVIMETIYVRTGDKFYLMMAKFWVKLFAATFSIGVATGIVLEFEFGTNWATYSRFVGDIFGSPLAAEGIFAFFLESGFLAVLLFGWDRVSPKMHLFSSYMVLIGSIMSAFWIVVANSWMQTPDGYHIVGVGSMMRAEIIDFWAMVFNPSALSRFSHVIIGSFLEGGFFVMSISAFYLIKKRHLEFAKKSMIIALIFTVVFSLLQLVQGHKSAEIVAEYQPAKLAAMEGLFQTQSNAPLYILGHPDVDSKETYGFAIPGFLSFLVHSDFNGVITGLDKFNPEDWPPVWITFQSYHIMVALGMYFIFISLLSLFLLWRGKLYDNTIILWVWVFSVVGPFIANQVGWIAAEVGRQPWIVTNLLRTADGVSKSVSGIEVLISLILFGILYMLLLFVWLFIVDRKIKAGPEDSEEIPILTAGGAEILPQFRKN